MSKPPKNEGILHQYTGGETIRANALLILSLGPKLIGERQDKSRIGLQCKIGVKGDVCAHGSYCRRVGDRLKLLKHSA